MKKFLELFIKYKEIVMYLIMGFATTFISWVSYSIFTFVFSAFSDGTNVLLSSIVSWTIAVIFAYFTNKIWVFESYSWKPSFVIAEFGIFISARIFTGIIEVFGTPLLVKLGVTGTIFGIKGMVSKVTISVVVIILNYVLSKLVIFKKEVEN